MKPYFHNEQFLKSYIDINSNCLKICREYSEQVDGYYETLEQLFKIVAANRDSFDEEIVRLMSSYMQNCRKCKTDVESDEKKFTENQLDHIEIREIIKKLTRKHDGD